MKKNPISPDTSAAILEATWALIVKKKRLDLGQAEIAEAAGVSRQTLYLAFGGRAGLLTAMLRHRDEQSDHVTRLRAISMMSTVTVEDFERYLGVWLEYLPLIYPVAILLEGASVSDEEAAAAIDDRMKGALLAGFEQMCKRLAKSGALAKGMPPERAAALIWSLVHPTAWRQLVVGCGWTAQEFVRSRLAIIRAVVLAPREASR